MVYTKKNEKKVSRRIENRGVSDLDDDFENYGADGGEEGGLIGMALSVFPN